LGSTTSSPLAGTKVNTCNNACVTLTASDIDNTPADNRYEWYSSDGNQSITSTTGYGKNGYSQTVTICPTSPLQSYYVIAYTGTCPEYARSEVQVETIIANANNPLNDEDYLYMCNTTQAIPTRVGYPDPIPSLGYTYQWTAADGGVISPTPPGNSTTAQPIITQAGTYNLVVSKAGCSRGSQVKVLMYPCCTTAVNSLKFPPYTKMSTVVNNIQNDAANCVGCITNNGTVVSNYDQIINFNGPLVMDILDKSVTFKDCDHLYFAADAKLSVRDSKTLTISNSNLDACTSKAWRGITTQTAQEEVNIKANSNIKNALIGLDTRNNALVTIMNSNFDKNKIHLKFTKYGGNVGSESKYTPDNPDDPDDFAGYTTTKGIAYNNFKNTGTMLSNITPNDRTTNGIWFENCLGSIKIGGVATSESYNHIDESNSFNKSIYSIYANGSGLNVANNIFTNFEQGVRSLDSKENQTYIVEGNNFASNYFFSTTNAELNNKGTAIYMVANANITPYTLSVKRNTIKYSRQAIFMSKFNGIPLITDLAGEFGGEIKENTITLYKDPDAADDFTHRAIVLMDNSGIDVVKNTIKTDPTTFSNLSFIKIDRYVGIDASNQLLGSDYFLNSFTELGKMIKLGGFEYNGNLQCNNFDKGTTANYPGIDNTTGITGIELQGSLAINGQGTSLKAAGNNWLNFPIPPTDYDRVRSTSGALLQVPYYRGTPDNQKPYNDDVFFTTLAPNNDCTTMQGMAANDGDDQGHSTVDLAKDGEGELDSLATYETTYDSTETVADLYADANQLLLALEAVATGELDSMAVIENFANTAVYQVYSLEIAMAAGDSTSIMAASSHLPKDIVGENYQIVALIAAKTTYWTAQDTVDLEYVAYQRVDEGGPSVINGRNMLGIYLDDITIIPKSNRIKRTSNGGWFVTVAPNPNDGNFILTTSAAVGASVKIYDSLGQLVSQCRTTAVNTNIAVEKLHAGLYHLALIDLTGKVLSTSFVIN
jgi:Secretion system C-terminal sorting domain